VSEIRLYTIGFTKKTAANFFGLINASGAKRVVDVRLNNRSQLAGFAKQKDLEFFLQEVSDMDYVHLPELAPTSDILTAYKKDGGDWDVYEDAFLRLMEEREIERRVDPALLNQGCLLCSEHEPHHCHRRLVAEYLNERWGGSISVSHLV
jgi:uncharacterized protein (DUF488 family)